MNNLLGTRFKGYFTLSLIVLAIFLCSCSDDQVTTPLSQQDNEGSIAFDAGDKLDNGLLPDGYYSTFWSDDMFAYSELSMINTQINYFIFLLIQKCSYYF